MRLFPLSAALAAILTAGSLPAVVIEENFKGYADYDPAHENWMFRGVGGEVIGGEYRFNGVAIEAAEEGDVHPALVMGQLRDFPAGPKVAAEAEFTLGGRGFSFLDPAKKTARSIGLVILDRKFSRGTRDAMTIPTLFLTLDESPDGARSVRFAYAGEPRLNPERTVTADAKEWNPAGSYRFSLTLADGTATGTITGTDGKVFFKGTLRDPAFNRVFSSACPGFANQRMAGALRSFRADNLDSAVPKPALTPIPLPSSWTLTLDKGGARTVTPGPDGMIDIAGIAGGFGTGRTARLECEVTAPATGRYIAGAEGDWFWRLSVNGHPVIDLMKSGNGRGEQVFELPLNAGKNRIAVEIGSGSNGWNYRLGVPDPEIIRSREARLHLYGADRVIWNLDRLIDDLKNLKRWKIEIPAAESEILALRRTIPADLSGRDAKKYDAKLDEFYLAVYNAYRAVQLDDLRREAAGIGELLNRDFSAELRQLELLSERLRRAVRSNNAAEAETVSASARQVLDRMTPDFDRFREGVSFGRNFGRFGWLTGDKVSSYSSGDGLLANQVLSSGGLLRQYVTSPDGKKPWRLDFRFTGTPDPATAERLNALPTVGENAEVEFGYDPSSFYSGSTPKQVKVKAINWVRKQFACADNFVADMSLASPALLLESALDTLVIDEPSTGPFTHIGYRNADGEIVSQPLEEGTVYDLESDGKLGANWVLLWSGNHTDTDLSRHAGSIPVQVVFQRQPKRIEKEGGQYRITLGKPGAVWLNTPFGARIQPAGNWLGSLPPAAAGRCDVQGRAALAYPVGLREYFRPAGDDRVELVNRSEFRRFDDNDWQLAPLEFTAVPPVLALMAERGFDAELPAELVDLGYPTIYGPLQAVPGDTLRCTLPVPQAPRTLFPRNTEAPADKVAELVKWNLSAVEGTRFRTYCENIARSWHSLTPTAGNGMATKSWNYLTPEFRAYIAGQDGFLTRNALGYRGNRFWRSLCEPYSGTKYFYSFSIACKDPGDVGVFGDRGYGVANHLLLLDLFASYGGCGDAVKAVWRDNSPLAPPMAIRDGNTVTVDKMQGYLTGVHDWAWMEAGSNDCGDNGPVVDCGQAVFGGVAALRRMAEEFGNDEERARASYHLAKSQLSQIGRPAFREYGHATGTLGPDHMNVGFREFITPDSFANSPMIGKTPRNEYDGSLDSLFCYAYLDCPDIYFPYAKYVWDDLRHYENDRAIYWPNRDRGKSSMMGHLYSRIAYLMLDGTPQSRGLELLDHWTKKAVFYERSGAVRETMPMALTGGCPLTLTEWLPLPAPDFTFTPSRKLARLTFRNVPEQYAFRAISSQPPAAVRVNGKAAEYDYDPAGWALSVALPAQETAEVEIEYAEIAPDRIQLMPLPPAPDRIPAAPGLDPESFTPAAAKARTPRVPEKELYRSNFSGPASAAQANAGGWSFNSWGDPKNPLSGGLTGDAPETGIPARALEIKAVPVNYAGRATGVIKLAPNLRELVLRGEFTLSRDYRGNRPRVFFWSGKSAHFFDLPAAKPGETKRFEIVLPVAELPAGTGGVNLQLISQFDEKQSAPPAGSVYFRSVVLTGR